MAREPRKTAILNVEYAPLEPVQPLIDWLLLDAGMESVVIARGRVTAKGSWYALAITGTPDQVDAALRGGPRAADQISRLLCRVA